MVGDQGAQAAAQAIRDGWTPEELSLDQAGLTDIGAESFVSILEQATHRFTLHLFYNSFSWEMRRKLRDACNYNTCVYY